MPKSDEMFCFTVIVLLGQAIYFRSFFLLTFSLSLTAIDKSNAQTKQRKKNGIGGGPRPVIRQSFNLGI
jgi:hypothetical protein